MTWLTVAFLVAVAAETITRLYLATRQIASVTAHRETVPEFFRAKIAPQDQRRASEYTVARVRLGRWATIFEAFLKIMFTLGGGLALVDSLIRPLALAEPWHSTVLVLAVLALMQLLGLPFALWRTFKVEARFGFNRTTLRLYMIDLFKQTVLGALLGAPLALVTVELMQRAGAQWWLWAWGVWLAFTLVLTWAAPRFIAPLFNRFSPLTDEALRLRLEALLVRCGYAAGGGLFVMDGSRRSAHGNAYFTGIGRNKRIVFFDTLLERIDAEEIEAVLAHELGHFRLHHVRQQLVISTLTTLVGFAVLAWFSVRPGFYAALGVPAASSGMALLLFLLTVPVFTYFLTPLRAWWSRRHEFQADQFAAQNADAGKLIGALVKLYRDNASTLTPDPVHSAFYDSHPPATVRIARLHAMVLATG